MTAIYLGPIENLRAEAPKIRPRAFAPRGCLAQWLRQHITLSIILDYLLIIGRGKRRPFTTPSQVFQVLDSRFIVYKAGVILAITYSNINSIQNY